MMPAASPQSAQPKQGLRDGAMMQAAMQSGARTNGSRRLLWNEFQRRLFLRRRRGFGSLHHGNARRSDGVSHTIRHWHGNYGSARSPIPLGHVRDQRFGVLFDRSAHDASYRATPTSSQLAPSAGCRIPGWLHDLFQLRVGDAQPGEGWGPVAGHLQRCRKRVAWIHGRMARLDPRGKALISH